MNAERIDLARHTALCLVRGAWAASGDTGLAPSAADAAGRLFESYALQLWDECDERLLREKGWSASAEHPRGSPIRSAAHGSSRSSGYLRFAFSTARRSSRPRLHDG